MPQLPSTSQLNLRRFCRRKYRNSPRKVLTSGRKADACSAQKVLKLSCKRTSVSPWTEVDDLTGHVIIAGYGRVGRMISELLNKELIPFVCLDVSAEEVAKGRARDMPVYFGDSGSATVLHAVGASKAACAVVTLDTPSANYRTVWAGAYTRPLLRST